MVTNHLSCVMTQQMTQITNLIRFGTVVDVDTTAGKVKVKTGNLETDWVSWISAMVGKDTLWLVPNKGDAVLLLSHQGNLSHGVALVGLWNKDAVPDLSRHQKGVVFEDGTTVLYDKRTQTLSIEGPDEIMLHSKQKINMQSEHITLGGHRKAARVGDKVRVVVDHGSSAGVYTGEIVSGSDKVSLG